MEGRARDARPFSLGGKMASQVLELDILCACGQPKGHPVHQGAGHAFIPHRGRDQVRDDQTPETVNRWGHSTIKEYRVVTSAAPAVSTDLSIQVPQSFRWRVQSLQATLVASAAAGNRIPHLVVKDSLGNVVYNYPSPGPQVAGATVIYSAGVGVVSASNDGATVLCLPISTHLLERYTIGFVTSALQAGDQWSAMALLVKEWIQY